MFKNIGRKILFLSLSGILIAGGTSLKTLQVKAVTTANINTFITSDKSTISYTEDADSNIIFKEYKGNLETVDLEEILKEMKDKSVVDDKAQIVEIGKFAFDDFNKSNCPALKKIIFPASVEEINQFGIYQCNKMKCLEFHGNTTINKNGIYLANNILNQWCICSPKTKETNMPKLWAEAQKVKYQYLMDTLSFVSEPEKKDYLYGELPVKTNFSLKGQCTGEEEEITFDEEMLNNISIEYNSKKVGKQDITISYGGKSIVQKDVMNCYNMSNDMKTNVEFGVINSVTYNGKEQKPKLNLINTINNESLTEGIDYTVEYQNNINVGEATVFVTGQGIYTGTMEKKFIIDPKRIDSKDITGEVAGEYKYTGKSIRPSDDKIVVRDGEVVLTKGIDYDIRYDAENINAGEKAGKIIITGKGNYRTDYNKEISFDIQPEDISNAKISEITPMKEDGTEKKPQVTVTLEDGTELIEYQDYTVFYKNNISAGTATVVINGIGNYNNTIEKNFKIKNDISKAVIVEIAEQQADKTPKTPEVKVTFDGITLVKERDYTVSYENNIEPGIATVTVTGTGDYAGKISKNFVIKGFQLVSPGDEDHTGETGNKVVVDVEIPQEEMIIVYDGTAKKPKPLVTVSVNGEEPEVLKEGIDYILTYDKDCTNIGLKTITVTFAGKYIGNTVTKTYMIIEKTSQQNPNDTSTSDSQTAQNPSGNKPTNPSTSGNANTQSNNTAQNPSQSSNTATTSAPSVPAAVGTVLTDHNLNCQVKVLSENASNPTVSYVKSENKNAKKVSVPNTIRIKDVTYKVTEIGKNVFKKNKKLTSVVIGKNVTKIGEQAFNGCKNLKKITIQAGNLKSIGKNAFKGINKKAVITVKGSKKAKTAVKKMLKSKKVGYIKTWKIN